MTRAAARRTTRHTEPAAGRVRPRGGRGRRNAGKSRRQAGIGLRSGCGRARRATRRTEPAARWVRPHGERGRARRATRRAGTRWLAANIRPSRGAQAKTGGGQNPRRAGVGRTGDAGGRAQGDAAGTARAGSLPISALPAAGGQNPAARRVRPHRRRGGHGTRWLPANIHPSRGTQAKTGARRATRTDKTRGTEG